MFPDSRIFFILFAWTLGCWAGASYIQVSYLRDGSPLFLCGRNMSSSSSFYCSSDGFSYFLNFSQSQGVLFETFSPTSSAKSDFVWALPLSAASNKMIFTSYWQNFEADDLKFYFRGNISFQNGVLQTNDGGCKALSFPSSPHLYYCFILERNIRLEWNAQDPTAPTARYYPLMKYSTIFVEISVGITDPMLSDEGWGYGGIMKEAGPPPYQIEPDGFFSFLVFSCSDTSFCYTIFQIYPDGSQSFICNWTNTIANGCSQQPYIEGRSFYSAMQQNPQDPVFFEINGDNYYIAWEIPGNLSQDKIAVTSAWSSLDPYDTQYSNNQNLNRIALQNGVLSATGYSPCYAMFNMSSQIYSCTTAENATIVWDVITRSRPTAYIYPDPARFPNRFLQLSVGLTNPLHSDDGWGAGGLPYAPTPSTPVLPRIWGVSLLVETY